GLGILGGHTLLVGAGVLGIDHAVAVAVLRRRAAVLCWIVAAVAGLVGAGVLAVDDAVGVPIGRRRAAGGGGIVAPDARRVGTGIHVVADAVAVAVGRRGRGEPFQLGQETHRRRALAGGDARPGAHRQPDLVGDHEAGPEQDLRRGGAL